MADASVVLTEGLTKTYGPTVALTDVDLAIQPGEVFGYLGPNGAGKTTTLRILMGLLRPTAGRATVLGRDVWRDSVAVHRSVGYVSGDATLYERLTGREHIAYLTRLHGLGTSDHALDVAGRLDLDLDRRVRTLSRGNRQKLAVALAFLPGPRLLLLDEPTSGLDPLAQQEFLALIRAHAGSGGTVLLSSHILSEVQQIADRVGILRSGRLIAVERLEDLRGKSLHRVSATFAGSASDLDLSGIVGVRDLHREGARISCSAPQSALDEILKAVARHPVVDFECAESSLEETFLAHYGSGEAGSDG